MAGLEMAKIIFDGGLVFSRLLGWRWQEDHLRWGLGLESRGMVQFIFYVAGLEMATIIFDGGLA